MGFKNSKILKYGAVLCAVCFSVFACKDKYLPNVTDAGVNYLVVEGLINTGADSTVFSVSRTFQLNGRAVIAPEKDAIVQVESDAGVNYVLPELVKSGTYGRPSLNLDQSKKYRLRIRTKNNKEYLSDFVESKTSPPIDDIKIDFRNDNVNILVNSHDATGNSRYYNFSYVGTWQYTARLYSKWKVENHQLLQRNFPQDDIYNCWHILPSTSITLGSTVSLSQDNLEKNILSIPISSSIFHYKYSVLVKQSVLTKAGFEFWENMRKNTEQVGSIFDSQPSQLFGNIHNTSNPSETVIGFISAGTVTEKRFNIVPQDLPYISPRPSNLVCESSMDTLYYADNGVKIKLLDPGVPIHTPISELISPSGFIIGYTASTFRECYDCRAQGGTNLMPSFW